MVKYFVSKYTQGSGTLPKSISLISLGKLEFFNINVTKKIKKFNIKRLKV